VINPSDPPWGEAEEVLRQEFRDKIIPICDEYSELIGEHGVLSEFFGAIVAYLVANDFVRGEEAAISFGAMFVNALRVALMETNPGPTVVLQNGDFDA